MGYYSTRRRRTERVGWFEIVLVVMVVVALVALVVFIVTQAGGGVLMN